VQERGHRDERKQEEVRGRRFNVAPLGLCSFKDGFKPFAAARNLRNCSFQVKDASGADAANCRLRGSDGIARKLMFHAGSGESLDEAGGERIRGRF